MKDDDKHVISLIEKREERERNFAQERDDMIKELSEIGLSIEKATAIAEDVLLCDSLAYQAAIILDRWGEENAETVIRLVEIMHRGAPPGAKG
jgi:hypothetical protein